MYSNKGQDCGEVNGLNFNGTAWFGVYFQNLLFMYTVWDFIGIKKEEPK